MVVVQAYEGMNATALFYPKNLEGDYVPVIDNTEENRLAVCKVIQRYNCEKKYSAKNCNCQTFAQDVYKALNLNHDFAKYNDPIGDYLNYIIGKKGRNGEDFAMLVSKGKIMTDPKTKKPLSWKTHEELDIWCSNKDNEDLRNFFYFYFLFLFFIFFFYNYFFFLF